VNRLRKNIVKERETINLSGKKSGIFVSIIVSTFNGSRYLSDTLKSFTSQTFSPSNFEILIVDNCSTDNTKEISIDAVKSNPNHNIEYIFESVPGLLSGRHRGALEAKGEIFIFVDDDIIADQNWLEAIVSTFHDPSVLLVGGRSLPKYEIAPPEWLEWFWQRSGSVNICGYLSILDLGDEEKEIDSLYVWGLNFSIRKSVIFDLGGFNPDCVPRQLLRYQGDGELGLTIKANVRGYKTIYQPKALVYHQIPKNRMTYEFFENRHLYQGIGDSYTYFRYKFGKYPPKPTQKRFRPRIPKSIKKPVKIVKNLLFDSIFRPISEQSPEEMKLKERFRKIRKKGYDFHQEEVRKDPELLKWVLKDNYWDYTLPITQTEKAKLEYKRQY